MDLCLSSVNDFGCADSNHCRLKTTWLGMPYQNEQEASMKTRVTDTLDVAIVKGVILVIAIIIAGLFLIANTALRSLLSGHGVSHVQARQPEPCRIVEKVLVAYVEGVRGATTDLSYSGPVQLTIEGTGKASGSAQSDAFYIFTDNQGEPIPPQYPQDWILTINSKPARYFTKNQNLPDYDPDHVYQVDISAPGGPLQFGIDDGYTPDNSGSLLISICQQ
jgi:hypothetical protein